MIRIIKKDGTIKTGNPTPGNDGISAYQVWLLEGNIGTMDDFLDSLVGPPGEPGPAGPAGTGSAYVHSESIPSTLWVISHNLGYFPGGVTVIDSSGQQIVGDVEHLTNNALTITFAAGFSGVAYLS